MEEYDWEGGRYRIGTWNLVPQIENHCIETWRKIRYNFPPSFLLVMGLTEKGRTRVYLDAPNGEWIREMLNGGVVVVKGIIAWREIASNSFKKQIEEESE